MINENKNKPQRAQRTQRIRKNFKFEISNLKFPNLCALCVLCGFIILSLSGCSKENAPEVHAEEHQPKIVAPPPPTVPVWLGNTSRNFYGTGPWPQEPLEVVWEFKTKSIAGRLHKDQWGGTSWPGQPSVAGDKVY
ncbi:MAG: hypothetical protein H7Y30_12075, partial [Pyrinomonadaceae bacterium]|nr:hypothetical protein [Pyrinomonadaceae bacterium]